MKTLLIFSFLLLISCQNNNVNEIRFNEEARLYCKCHGGIDRFVYASESYDLLCKDGTGVKGKATPISEVHFYANCDK